MTTHILVFPFLSKGHIIPLLRLSQLLLNRGVAVTLFTTAGNRPFISQSLSGACLSIIDLPFPDHIPGIPKGVESTDKLPSMSLFPPFATALKSMQPFFEEVLRGIHWEATCLVSDGFLPWTLESASKFGIPRLSYFGMGYYASVVMREAAGLVALHESDDEPFTLSRFPWITLTRNHFDDPFNKRDPRGPHLDFIKASIKATNDSYGLLMNSFFHLEPLYVDFFKKERRPKAWAIGPLCLTKLVKNNNFNISNKPTWMEWLDLQSSRSIPVLYVAFGSQATISPAQLLEIARGLEEARVGFLWVMKKSEMEKISGSLDRYEERVKDKGMIVTEWVEQEEILQHSAVKGFLSHCGWNSVLEGICGGVPIIAWPVMAEQFLNAKLVVEEIKIGVRVKTVDGSVRGFVSSKSLCCAVKEVMEGVKGGELRATVREVAAAARRAVAEGGSSWCALEELISEIEVAQKTGNNRTKGLVLHGDQESGSTGPNNIIACKIIDPHN